MTSRTHEGPIAVIVKHRTTIISHASHAACVLFLAKQRATSWTVSGTPVLVVSQLIIGAITNKFWREYNLAT